jgi:hypothetical protein
LTTPLAPNSILLAKVLGCVVTPRREWLLLAVVWGMGWATGSLSLTAIPCFLGAWFVYAIFMACLGAYFSVVCRSTQRAVLGTLCATIAILFVLVLVAYTFLEARNAVVGVVPPFVLGTVAYFPEDFKSQPLDSRTLAYALGALVTWSALAALVGYMASLRFRLSIGTVQTKKLLKKLGVLRLSSGQVP